MNRTPRAGHSFRQHHPDGRQGRFQVVFDDGTQTLGTATLNSSGVATFITSRVSGGNRTITASFQGDGNYNTSSNTTTQTVNKAASQTALTSTPTTSTYGQFVTLTATVTGVSGGNAPTGTVTFMDGSTTLGVVTVSAGLAVLTTQMLSVGSGKTLAANFTGDGNYNASSGSTTQTVNKATPPTGLTGSAAASNYGKTVTFTATVTGVSGVTAPTGTVTFTVGTMVLGTVALGSNGQAVLATAAVGGGANQTITATYNGDANYTSNYATTTLTVYLIGSMMQVSSSPNGSIYGQSVAFTATLSPTYNVTIDSGASLPTGTVTFTAGSVTLGTAAISNGVAVVNSAALNAGFGQAITATYNGDGNYTGSSGTTTQSVNKASPTVAVSGSPSTSTYGDLVTFTATIGGVSGGTVPSGTVSFSSGSVQLGSATITNGQAILSTSLVNAGSQTVSALYQGDSNYNMASGSTTQTVSQAASTASVYASPSVSDYYGQAVTITATVTGVSGALVPTGMIQFMDGTTGIGGGSLDANGQAAFTITTLSVGDHSITAIYGGDGNYLASTSAAQIETVITQATISFPSAQWTNLNASLVFSSANGNAISVTEFSPTISPLKIDLSVDSGTLSLSKTTGLTFTAGTGTGDTSMTFSGSVSDINAALDGLTFNPAKGYHGLVTISGDVDFSATSQQGGPAIGSVEIAVGGPSIHVPGQQSTNSSQPLTFSGSSGNDIYIIDPPASAAGLQVTLAVTNGTLTLINTNGLMFLSGTGSGDTSMSFTGSLDAINTALLGLTYTPTSAFVGQAALSMTAQDLGTGWASGSTNSASVNIAVGGPSIQVPGNQWTNSNTAKTFSPANANAITVSDPTGSSTSLAVTIYADNAALTLPSTAGLTFTNGSANGGATLSFTGTVADINAALNGMTFAPTTDFRGAASLSITADEVGSALLQTAYASVAVVVGGIIVAANLQATTDENKLVGVWPLDSALSASSGTLTVSVASGPTNGTATVDPTANSIFYTPTTGFVGLDTLTYQISDGLGATATATISFTVNFVNAAGWKVGPRDTRLDWAQVESLDPTKDTFADLAKQVGLQANEVAKWLTWEDPAKAKTLTPAQNQQIIDALNDPSKTVQQVFPGQTKFWVPNIVFCTGAAR